MIKCGQSCVCVLQMLKTKVWKRCWPVSGYITIKVRRGGILRLALHRPTHSKFQLYVHNEFSHVMDGVLNMVLGLAAVTL